MAKKQPDKLPDKLSKDEQTFIHLKFAEGLTFNEIYKTMHPKSRMSKKNMCNQGWKTYQKIKPKLASWAEIFEQYDVGPDALIKVYKEGLKANHTIVIGGKVAQVPDHRARLAAAKEVKDVHGLSEQTINLKTEQALPLIVVMEDGEDEDDRP